MQLLCAKVRMVSWHEHSFIVADTPIITTKLDDKQVLFSLNGQYL